MDKKENKVIEFQSWRFCFENTNFIKIIKRKRYNKYDFMKKNKEITNISNNKMSYNRYENVSKFICYEKQNNIFSKIIENLILTFFINIILLNIKGIVCESYIVVKINKPGEYNIIFNEGVEYENNHCNGIIMHIPISVKINEIPIDSFTGKYEFTRDENTIKLFYEESKNNFKCLFYGCSDIDEIDVSHLITSNVNDLSYMFYLCNSLTSLIISNIDTSSVLYFGNMFYSCKSLTSLDLSNFNTEKAINMQGMFDYCNNFSRLQRLH